MYFFQILSNSVKHLSQIVKHWQFYGPVHLVENGYWKMLGTVSPSDDSNLPNRDDGAEPHA